MSTQGFVKAAPATVQLTTGAPGHTSVASSVGVVTTGVWNGTRLAPSFLPNSAFAGGTVTSVGLTVPGVIFTSPVAGSPITTSGTLALALKTQTANTVFASATSGGVATPTFRALVAADIPTIPASGVSGLAAIATSGSATDLITGTVPAGRIAGAYTGITGLGSLASLSVTGTAVINSMIQLKSTAAGAGTTPYALEIGRADNQPLDANHQIGIYLDNPGTGIGAGIWTKASGIFNLSDGSMTSANGQLNLGTLQVGTYANSPYYTVNFGTTLGLATGGMLQLNTSFQGTGSSSKANGILLTAAKVDTAGALTVPIYSSGNYVFSSTAGVRTVTLPALANSYVGQTITLLQEGNNVLTVGVPAGVTVTMKTGVSLVTGADILTTRTAANFTSPGTAGTDSTSATIVCTATDAATAATWRQISGVGDWN